MENKNVYDKMFDIMLVEALKEVESESAENVKEEIDFSSEHKASMKKIFDKERKKIYRKKIYRYARRAAVVFMAAVLVSGAAVMSVSALRIKFLNFVTDIYQTHTEITATEETKGGTYDTDKLKLGYIPEGYVLLKQDISGDMFTLVFGNDTEKFSVSMIPAENSALNIDTEDSDCETIDINGTNAFYSENSNGKILTMIGDEEFIIISGSIERDEFVKIAQNLEKK